MERWNSYFNAEKLEKKTAVSADIHHTLPPHKHVATTCHNLRKTLAHEHTTQRADRPNPKKLTRFYQIPLEEQEKNTFDPQNKKPKQTPETGAHKYRHASQRHTRITLKGTQRKQEKINIRQIHENINQNKPKEEKPLFSSTTTIKIPTANAFETPDLNQI